MVTTIIRHDLEYLAIFSLVLLLPKILLKVRIPSGITALIIGAIFTMVDPSIKNEQLFRFLAQIGITSLFVFSGLEVEFDEIKADASYLSKYILKSVSVMFVIAYFFSHFMHLSLQNALILSLGIFTPSAGFIINSLHSFKIGEDQEYWVKSKAISKEVISIVLMFIAMQLNDLKMMAISTLFFVSLFFILPYVFKLFFKFISPYAPHSEVPFLVVLSLIAGVLSKELGAYYLVGAFVVGLVGARFKEDIFKEDEEMIFKALSSFFTVFLPFYFFYAGVNLNLYHFSYDAIILGSIFLLIFVPLRLMVNATSITYFMKDWKKKPYDISLSLMPTLIFGLVIAGVLKSRGGVNVNIIYALIFYTLISSLIPSIVFGLQKRSQE